MIKAAFFDVDGTLLSHATNSVPQSAREAVAKLRAQGILCVLATGRQIRQMRKLPIADMEFDGYLTLNGQLTLDGNQKMLYGTPITGKTKDFCVKMFSENRLPALLVEEEDVYLNFEDDRVRLVQKAINTETPPFGQYTGKDIYQVCIYLAKGEEELLAEIADECVMSRWNIGGVDVVAKGGGKVTGIQRFLEGTGITREEIIAFGDAENDMDMLRFAGIGVAMGNALDEVKEVADFVTTDVDDNGIANALKHFGLI